MDAISLDIPEVFLFTPRVFGDERGFFFESFQASRFSQATGLNPDFVQDNHSRSTRGVPCRRSADDPDAGTQPQ